LGNWHVAKGKIPFKLFWGREDGRQDEILIVEMQLTATYRLAIGTIHL
jgi:hypothetical protein